jgi:integrase
MMAKTVPQAHKKRTVPLPELLLTHLGRQCRSRSRDDLLFPATTAGTFAARIPSRGGSRRPSQQSKVPRTTPHDLRHTAASLAVSAGANVKAVQKMLGHASAAMTLDIYADLFDDDLEAVAVALNDAKLSESVGKMWARSREPTTRAVADPAN